MSNPRYSIIVPIYNVENYLQECIDSILNQTFIDFELILVDDGSKDNSPQICDDCAAKDKRVRVIHKPNGGLVSARKAGANVATGDYVVCVDGDDAIKENLLQSTENVLKEVPADIVCFGATYVFNGGREGNHTVGFPEGLYNRAEIEKNFFPQLIEDENSRYFPPSVWGKAFKRELYVEFQNRVDDRIRIGEDHACTKPILYNAASVYILNDCLYCYRQNEASMTKNRKPFDTNVPKLIGKHFEENIDMQMLDFQEQVYRSVVHNLFNVCVSQYNRKEKNKVIRKDIMQLLNDRYYSEAINNCSYAKKNIKGKLALFAMNGQCLWLMRLYNGIVL